MYSIAAACSFVEHSTRCCWNSAHIAAIVSESMLPSFGLLEFYTKDSLADTAHQFTNEARGGVRLRYNQLFKALGGRDRNNSERI